MVARRRRAQIEAQVEELIALLDGMDGDCDLEDGNDLENDGYDERERDTSDDEHELGWTIDGQRGDTFDTDRELDPAEAGIADEDALHDVHEELSAYQHHQAKGDREKQRAVCENVTAEARSKKRRKGKASAPTHAEPFSFGLALAQRVQWGVRS